MSSTDCSTALTSSCWPVSMTQRSMKLISVFGHRRVDRVVRHLIADAVRAPAERELGQVARADHEPALVVGEPEQVRGALAGLDVLERDVVDLLAAAYGCSRSLSICSAPGGCRSPAPWRRAPPSASRRCPSCARSSRSRAACRRGRSRAAGRAGPSRGRARSARAWSPGPRRRRSRPSRSRSRAAASRGRGPGCCRPRSSARCASWGRRARTGSARSCGAAASGSGPARPRSRRGGTPRCRSLWSCDRVAEAVRARAVREHPVEVDVGDQQLLVVGEALGLGDQVAVLVDHRLAVPGEVGRRLAAARGGVDVGGDAARRLAADERVAEVGLADRDVARRAGWRAPSRPASAP